MAVGGGSFRRQRYQMQVMLALEFGVGLVLIPVALMLRGRLLAMGWTTGEPDYVLTAAVCFWLLLLGLGIHQHMPGLKTQVGRNWTLMQAFGLSACMSFASLFLLRGVGTRISRPTVAIFALMAACGLSLAERLARGRLEHVAGGRLNRVVVVGGTAEVDQMLAQLGPGANRSVCALVRNDPEATSEVEQRVGELYRVLRSRAADEVLLTADILRGTATTTEFCRQVVAMCEETGVHLSIWAGWLPGHSTVYVDYLGQSPVLTYEFRRATYWGLLAKRGLDLLIAVPALVLVMPLLTVAAVAIKLDSTGPVLFLQQRTGFRGRPFEICKLRSMSNGAESMEGALRGGNELQGPAFKLERDPRVTRVGKLLRRSSIDELPQLWNVIVGDMSLVGPRPAPLAESDQYAPGHMRKLAMKPGITGLWQVSGRTCVKEFESRVELDAEYIREWSLWLDFKILLRTVMTVARMTGV